MVDRGFRLTRLLVQNRFLPVSIDKQILFLYSALNGFLDHVSVDVVSMYESEFYRFYNADVAYIPLRSNLLFKDNSMDLQYVYFMIWYFAAEFEIFMNDIYKNFI